jgi:hypothetical protein
MRDGLYESGKPLFHQLVRLDQALTLDEKRSEDRKKFAYLHGWM